MSDITIVPIEGKRVFLNGRMLDVITKLYDGPFSKVFVVNESGVPYAMKIESSEGPLRPVLKLDALVLKQLNAKGMNNGFPQLITSGKTPLYKYIIMELVGPDLQRLRRAMPSKRFSMLTTLRIATQTLRRIEALHDCGWLCRDVKASNFCVGKENLGLIHMLDFGFARKYMRENGDMVEPRTAAGLMGTIFYASLNAHSFYEQCRKDDLESWFYMIVEMVTGSLPWLRHDPKRNHMLIGECKRFVRNSGRHTFLANCPVQFDCILKEIDSTGFNARPRYFYIHSCINEAMDNLMIDEPKAFEWQADPRIVTKARFVGERGESDLASNRIKEFENGKMKQ